MAASWRMESRMTPSWKTALSPFPSPPPTGNHLADRGPFIFEFFFSSQFSCSGLLCFWTPWPSLTISNVLTYGVGRVWLLLQVKLVAGSALSLFAGFTPPSHNIQYTHITCCTASNLAILLDT